MELKNQLGVIQNTKFRVMFCGGKWWNGKINTNRSSPNIY
jgi:hypothetical protein